MFLNEHINRLLENHPFLVLLPGSPPESWYASILISGHVTELFTFPAWLHGSD